VGWDCLYAVVLLGAVVVLRVPIEKSAGSFHCCCCCTAGSTIGADIGTGSGGAELFCATGDENPIVETGV